MYNVSFKIWKQNISILDPKVLNNKQHTTHRARIHNFKHLHPHFSYFCLFSFLIQSIHSFIQLFFSIWILLFFLNMLINISRAVRWNLKRIQRKLYIWSRNMPLLSSFVLTNNNNNNNNNQIEILNIVNNGVACAGDYEWIHIIHGPFSKR